MLLYRVTNLIHSIHPDRLRCLPTDFVMKTAKKKSSQNDDQRRNAILSSALECFLKFGYSKTSIDDIAKRAKLARSLLYLKYKNKEEIFKGVFEYIIGDGYEEARKVLSVHSDKRKALFAIYDALILKPWAKIIGQPMSEEFYETCSDLSPDVSAHHDKIILKYTTAILQDRKLAEVFVLSAIGLQDDLPTVDILRDRLKLLIERFV